MPYIMQYTTRTFLSTKMYNVDANVVASDNVFSGNEYQKYYLDIIAIVKRRVKVMV